MGKDGDGNQVKGKEGDFDSIKRRFLGEHLDVLGAAHEWESVGQRPGHLWISCVTLDQSHSLSGSQFRLA